MPRSSEEAHDGAPDGARSAATRDAATARGATVRAEGFGWQYPGRETPAFSGLDLEIPAGQKVLLLGPSGAGKSTVLHALAGVLEEDEDQRLGRVLVDGREGRAARGLIGLMQQDPEASIVMARVDEDLAFGPENLAVDPAEIPARRREALDAVGLDLAPDRSTSALSGGQKQRLGLAGILAMHPRLLLLDEPTANLDPQGVEDVRDAVVRASERLGSTLVVVEHRVAVWAPFVDRVVVLRPGGGISHDGTPEQVLEQAGAELAAAGIWVPGHRPALAPAPNSLLPTVPAQGAPEAEASASAPGTEASAHAAPPPPGTPSETLLEARDLAVTRQAPERRWVRRRRRAVSPGAPAPRSDDAAREPWARDAATAVEHVHARVRSGRHLAVLGPNGAGKSTLALALAGLSWPASGVVVASAELIEEANGQAPRSRARRSRGPVGWDPMAWDSRDLIPRIGTVFQEPEHQFMRPSVRQELELGARVVGDPEPERTADRLLERLRLAHVAEANPFTLSGGEKRRLSVGTALAARPRVLVLDEPTFGQDAVTWARLVELLRELLVADTAVVSVTHDLDFVDALGGDRLVLGGPGIQPVLEDAGEETGADATQAAGVRPADREEADPWTS